MSSLFDYEGSLKRMGGDDQLFREMVGFFFADAPGWLAQVKQGMARGDGGLVQRSAHTLKGMVSNFGAHSTMQAAAAVEQRVQEDSSLRSAEPAVARLEAAITELEAALAPYQLSPGMVAR